MAIGRTFKEALQKGLRSLEIKRFGLESLLFNNLLDIKADAHILSLIEEKLKVPNAERIFYIADAFRAGMDIDKIFSLTKVDRWFLSNIQEITDLEKKIAQAGGSISKEMLKEAKEFGFSDRQLAKILNKKEEEIYDLRKGFNIDPVFKLVDTCAAEFQAHTPYFYSTYDS